MSTQTSKHTPTEAFKVEVDFKPMVGLGGGFRQEWISGEDGEGLEFGLDSGAGVGNPLLTFWVKEKGGKREYYTSDVQQLVKALIAKLKP